MEGWFLPPSPQGCPGCAARPQVCASCQAAACFSFLGGLGLGSGKARRCSSTSLPQSSQLLFPISAAKTIKDAVGYKSWLFLFFFFFSSRFLKALQEVQTGKDRHLIVKTERGGGSNKTGTRVPNFSMTDSSIARHWHGKATPAAPQ